MNTLEIMAKLKEIGEFEFGDDYHFCSCSISVMSHRGKVSNRFSLSIFLKNESSVGSEIVDSLEVAWLQLHNKIKAKKCIPDNSPIEIGEEASHE